MADETSLSDVVQNAVSEWCSAADNSMVTNFVFVAEFIEEDGSRSAAVVSPEGCSTAAGLGLCKFGLNLFTEIQRRDVLELIYTDEGDDE
jgi:hypothetical protein